MSPSTILGYAARTLGQPLELFTYEPPKLEECEVRVSVTHCGVCHTDIHAIDDYYGITTFPFVPGHEIVGNVSEAGPAVVGLKEGDRVGIGWQGRSCGKCEWCLKGETQLCMKIEDTTVRFPTEDSRLLSLQITDSRIRSHQPCLQRLPLCSCALVSLSIQHSGHT